MRKTTRDRNNIRDELAMRFFQLSRQRKNNNEKYMMWGDLAYYEKAKQIDAAMQKICDEYKHYDDIEYRSKLVYNNFYRNKNRKATLTNGYCFVYLPENEVDEYITYYYPEFYRVK